MHDSISRIGMMRFGVRLRPQVAAFIPISVLTILLILSCMPSSLYSRDSRAAKRAEDKAVLMPAQASLLSTMGTWWLPAGVPNASTHEIRDVEYLPTGVIWLSGYALASPNDDVVWKSSDHGKNWVQFTVLPGGAGLMGLAAYDENIAMCGTCLLYTSPSPRDRQKSRMPSSA